MKYSFAGLTALAAVANAHTTIWNIWLNDVDQGVGNTAGGYIRFPPNNSPVKDITSKDMTCNVANTANTKTVTVTAGDKVTIEWHHDTNSASDDIIAASHKGPVMVYIAPTASNGAGDVWVKLAEDGYDGSSWAVDKLIANKGKHSFTLPASLADGEYLIRPEIIALHESDTAFNVNSARGAQLYMECIQVKVTGGGSTTLPAGVAIPGAYSYADPGILFNLYGSFTSYTIPGPAVWDGTSSGSTTPASSSKAVVVPSSTKAAVPASTKATVATSAVAVSSKASVATSAPVVAVPATSIAAPAVSAPVSSKIACSVKVTPTTLQTVTKPVATSGSSAVSKWGQCGGIGFGGSTTCATGTTCKVQNPYYSQCL